MSPRRRAWLGWLALMGSGRAAAAGASPGTSPAVTPQPAAGPGPGSGPGPDEDSIRPGRRLLFPRAHGAHPGARIEWWYATGWLQAEGSTTPTFGWQLTFFRSRTGLAESLPGRFAARQLLFAHAAITDLGARRHRHAERITRWSGADDQPEAHARRADTALALGAWTLQRHPADGRYTASLPALEAGFTLDLVLQPTQPVLLQGQDGHSRKGPQPVHASHYYSWPQLAVQARLTQGGRSQSLPGHGWLDHEWSDELMPEDAVGWDWIGINLADGGALTAFRLRRRDGSVVWAGGSHRPAGGAVRAFGPASVQFTPQRHWLSPDTGARYPVQWQVETPAGRFTLVALLDSQELDSRGSTGAIYWEGLASLGDVAGRQVGLGYLEMTGYASPLRLR